MKTRFKTALHVSMKTGDKLRTSTLRLILTAINDLEISLRTNEDFVGITDDRIVGVLTTMIKGRKTSAQLYNEAGRIEQSIKEEAEIAIITEFLPKQLSPEEVELAISKAMIELGTTSVRDMGALMKFMKTEYAGKIDMSSLGKAVREKLA